MLTLNVGAETKSKRLRSHRQPGPHRQRLEFRAIGNSFSSLVRITETDHGLNITMKSSFPCRWLLVSQYFADAKTNTPRKSETPKSQRTKDEIQSERTREVEMSPRERPAATPRISRTSTPVFSSSRIMEAGGLHYSFAGCAASWRA
jgi:hypothetical protein